MRRLALPAAIGLVLGLLYVSLVLSPWSLATQDAVAAEEKQTNWGKPCVKDKDSSSDESNVSRKGLGFRQRRAMGLTIRNLRKTLEQMQADGELEGKTTETIAVEVLEQLVEANPTAFQDASIDWDAILEFVIKLIPLILKIIALFS